MDGFPAFARLRTFAVCIALAVTFAANAAWPAAVVVPDQLPTIQTAINSKPDTVLVRAGSYPENIVLDGLGPALLRHPGSGPNDTVRVDRLRIETCCHDHLERGISVVGIHIRGPVTLQTFDTSVPWVEFISCRIDSGVVQLFKDPDAVSRQTFTNCVIRGSVYLTGGKNNVFQHNQLVDGNLTINTDYQITVTDNLIDGGSSGGNLDGIVSGTNNVLNVNVERNRIRGFRRGIAVMAEWARMTDNIVSDCTGDGILIAAGTSAEVSRNRVTDAENGILVRAAWIGAFENVVLASRQSGIDLTSKDSILVVGNIVGRSLGDGIVARTTTECCVNGRHRFESNTSYRNAGSGFVIYRGGKEPENALVKRNIAYRNGGWGLDFRSFLSTIPVCNDWFGNALGAVQGLNPIAPGPSDFDVDPLFCNPDADSVWLSSTSSLLESSGCGVIGALGQGCGTTTATLLSRMTATPGTAGIAVRWEFANDRDLVRTWLERSDSRPDTWSEVALEPRRDGAEYVCVDPEAIPGRTYRYRAAWLDAGGGTFRSGLIEARGIGRELALAAVLPNPSEGPVRFEFTLPQDGYVELGIYDLNGRRIARLAHGTLAAGVHTLQWESGSAPPGLYFVRLLGEGGALSRTFALTR